MGHVVALSVGGTSTPGILPSNTACCNLSEAPRLAWQSTRRRRAAAAKATVVEVVTRRRSPTPPAARVELDPPSPPEIEKSRIFNPLVTPTTNHPTPTVCGR